MRRDHFRRCNKEKGSPKTQVLGLGEVLKPWTEDEEMGIPAPTLSRIHCNFCHLIQTVTHKVHRNVSYFIE